MNTSRATMATQSENATAISEAQAWFAAHPESAKHRSIETSETPL